MSEFPSDFDADRARRDKPYAQRKLRQYKGEIQKLEDDLALSKDKLDGLSSILPKLQANSLQLERNDCSRAHKLREAFRLRRVFDLKSGDRIDSLEHDHIFDGVQSFVVTNDWASALGQAIDEAGGEMKLPFPMCLFEFRISGATTLIWCGQQPDVDGAEGLRALAFLDTGTGVWLTASESARDEPFFQFAWKQIVAVCVALDAEVASRSVVRAPSSLNVKREKHGKPKISDYHVVSLAKRYRVTSAGGASDTRRHPRLHFRRGHWRHYESHKTWINWMLVGNPDLGFIAKHYSL